jgi:hypothetical protein
MVVVGPSDISEALISELVLELRKLEGSHAVVFDGAPSVGVFSDGLVLKTR